MNKTFDIVISGVGGQGILTLAAAISRAAISEGWQVKASELHGLSVRFGPIEVHLRMSKDEIFSPLVAEADADLIISQEPIEALRVARYASRKKTTFLIDTETLKPNILYQENKKYPSISEIKTALKPFAKKILTIDAAKKVKLSGAPIVAANTFLLGYASKQKLIPLKVGSLMKGMEQVTKPGLLEINKKVFQAGYKK